VLHRPSCSRRCRAASAAAIAAAVAAARATSSRWVRTRTAASCMALPATPTAAATVARNAACWWRMPSSCRTILLAEQGWEEWAGGRSIVSTCNGATGWAHQEEGMADVVVCRVKDARARSRAALVVAREWQRRRSERRVTSTRGSSAAHYVEEWSEREESPQCRTIGPFACPQLLVPRVVHVADGRLWCQVVPETVARTRDPFAFVDALPITPRTTATIRLSSVLTMCDAIVYG